MEAAPHHTPMYTSQGTLLQDTLTIVMSPLKYFVTEAAWSEGVISATQTLLNDHRNIIGILQEYYRQQCVSMILSLFRDYTLLLVTLTMKVALLYRVYRLQYSIELIV